MTSSKLLAVQLELCKEQDIGHIQVAAKLLPQGSCQFAGKCFSSSLPAGGCRVLCAEAIKAVHAAMPHATGEAASRRHDGHRPPISTLSAQQRRSPG